MPRYYVTAALVVLGALPALAHENEVDISRVGDQICVSSNGVPTHEIGTFPNSGNPNSFAEQNARYCVDATPEFTGTLVTRTIGSGVSITGIPFRPNTADYYDASSRRGFSRDPSSGWWMEGMGAADSLGMDAANAHVDERGLYHYHSVSEMFLEAIDGSMIGWAADGFEIHYVGDAVQSSYQLRDGTRPTDPFGVYDGTFVEDWVNIEGSGSLDECNGAMVNGTYTYFATDTYPFYPRCFRGDVSADFLRR